MAGLPLEHAWSNVRIRSGTSERVIALSMRIICLRLESRQKTIGRLAPADRTAKAQVPPPTRVTLTLLFLAILLSATGARGNVTVPDVISNSMVLQRDRAVPIWGRADPGETVVIMFASPTSGTKAGRDGKWGVTSGRCLRALRQAL